MAGMNKSSKPNVWASKSGISPQWQTIEKLIFVGSKIDEILTYTKEQHRSLFILANDESRIADDETLDRVIRYCNEQEEDIGIYTEQLRRWKNEPLGSNQENEIIRLIKQVEDLKRVNDTILSLAHELKKSIIDGYFKGYTTELSLNILMGDIQQVYRAN